MVMVVMHDVMDGKDRQKITRTCQVTITMNAFQVAIVSRLKFIISKIVMNTKFYTATKFCAKCDG